VPPKGALWRLSAPLFYSPVLYGLVDFPPSCLEKRDSVELCMIPFFSILGSFLVVLDPHPPKSVLLVQACVFWFRDLPRGGEFCCPRFRFLGLLRPLFVDKSSTKVVKEAHSDFSLDPLFPCAFFRGALSPVPFFRPSS